MNRPPAVLDLFAGPGGWDEGLASLGVTDVLGIEQDPHACATAETAGHRRRQADVTDLDPADFDFHGLIAAPPCQEFSQANLSRQGIGSVRGALVHEVLRWAEQEPRWIACEQVPEVLPIWRAFAHELEAAGYRTWTGVLRADHYGVPQTRTRAFLLASLDVQPQAPEPTHHDPSGGLTLLDLAPWVTVADALGLGPDDERVLVAAGVTGEGRPREPSRPAPTITGKGTAYWIFERPATTVVGSFCPDVIAAPGYRTDVSRQDAPGSLRTTVQENGVLQGFRPDYPWQGPKTSQYQQVGNAVPPPLAAAVLRPIVGAVEAARTETPDTDASDRGRLYHADHRRCADGT